MTRNISFLEIGRLLSLLLYAACLLACSSTRPASSLPFELAQKPKLEFKKISDDPFVYQQESTDKVHIFFSGLRDCSRSRKSLTRDISGLQRQLYIGMTDLRIVKREELGKNTSWWLAQARSDGELLFLSHFAFATEECIDDYAFWALCAGEKNCEVQDLSQRLEELKDDHFAYLLHFNPELSPAAKGTQSQQ